MGHSGVGVDLDRNGYLVCSLFEKQSSDFVSDFQPKDYGIKRRLPTAFLPIYSVSFWRKLSQSGFLFVSVPKKIRLSGIKKCSTKTIDAMNTLERVDGLNLKERLQNDNVFVKQQLVSLSSLTGLGARRGLERVIVSENQVVNVVSCSYGHLPNENFFYEVERKLIDAGIEYVTRSINRDNRSFAVDYILSDDKWIVKVYNGIDRLRPMLRFTNSYDGTCKTSGHFGFFREVCTNGLHTAHSQVGFSVKHRGAIVQVVIPEINELVLKFMNNEFYSIHRKFEVLSEKPIKDLRKFVKVTADFFRLFQFECSEKNAQPSRNARLVIEGIEKEAWLLNTKPNYWLGYNAFNALLHGKLKKTFEAQAHLDAKVFEHLLTR